MKNDNELKQKVLFGEVDDVNKCLNQLSVEALNAKDDNGKTVLMWAANNDREDALKVLIKAGADIHSKDNDGKTALALASMNGNTEVVEKLIKAGADIHSKDNYGKTALLHLVANNKAIIEAHDLNAGHSNFLANVKNGQEALSSTLKSLLDNGADIQAKDNTDKTALALASINGNTKLVESLVKVSKSENIAALNDKEIASIITPLNPNDECNKKIVSCLPRTRATKIILSLNLDTDKTNQFLSFRKKTRFQMISETMIKKLAIAQDSLSSVKCYFSNTKEKRNDRNR